VFNVNSGILVALPYGTKLFSLHVSVNKYTCICILSFVISCLYNFTRELLNHVSAHVIHQHVLDYPVSNFM
jgi:hypothetical protein